MAALAGRCDHRTALPFHDDAPWNSTHQRAGWIADASPARGRDPGPEAAAGVADIDRAVAIGRARDGPVFRGELGVVARAAPPDRRASTAAVRRAAEARGIAWCAGRFGANVRLDDTAAGTRLGGTLPALVD
jgi:hypothetical protein